MDQGGNPECHEGAPPIRTDICIIGSGPAGSTIFSELREAAIDVVLLESGASHRHPYTDSLNEIENVGAPRVIDQWSVRNRMLGGSSHTWMGRCAAFDDIDYESRPWVPHSGWPFDASELAPYQERVAAHLGLATERDLYRRRPHGRDSSSSSSRLDRRYLEPIVWQYSKDPSNPYDFMRFGSRLMNTVTDKARIFTGATALHINTNEAVSAAESVDVVFRDGQRTTVFASVIVLCAGAIENSRLLLASNRNAGCGLGNARDLVGRYLMDHPRGSVASFDMWTANELPSQFGLYTVRASGGVRMFRQGVKLSPSVQRAEGLLNCSAWVSEVVTEDDPWHALKRVLRGKAHLRRDVAIIGSNAGLLAKGLRHHLTGRGSLPRKLRGLELDVMVEQCPDPDSRVTLSDRTDAHGLPLSRISWRIGEQEQETVCRTAELVEQEFVRLGKPRPRLADWVRGARRFPASFLDVAHPTGTTRMSETPATGVVDPQCQVHGISGLYVSGSSVFPTCSHANPTQMIVTMAVRLADTLKARLRAESVGADVLLSRTMLAGSSTR